MEKDHYVYICRGSRRKVLYVGCSKDPFGSRAITHRASSQWFSQMRSIEVLGPMPKDAALHCERMQTVKLDPVHNISGTKDWLRSFSDVPYSKRLKIFEDRNRKMRELYLSGLSMQKIASRFHLSRQRVHKILNP